MTGKSNGQGKPEGNVFDSLATMIVNLGSARTKAEAMARNAVCQKMVRAIRDAFMAQSQKVGHLQKVILQATGGEFRQLALNVEGDPVHYRFTDSAGKPILVVDADQALVLVTPETVEPIIVDVELKDGTTKRIVVKHAKNDEEAKKLLAVDQDARKTEPADERANHLRVVDDDEDRREHHKPLRVPVDEG